MNTVFHGNKGTEMIAKNDGNTECTNLHKCLEELVGKFVDCMIGHVTLPNHMSKQSIKDDQQESMANHLANDLDATIASRVSTHMD